MRVWSLKTVLFLLLCAGIGLLATVAPPSARAADDASTQLQVGVPPAEFLAALQNTTSGEFAHWSLCGGRYGSSEELLNEEFVASQYLDKCDIAVSEDGQQFIVLVRAGHLTWFTNQHGLIRESDPTDTVGELLSIEQFFSSKVAGGPPNPQQEEAVFQHYAKRLTRGIEMYAGDHAGCYPSSMKEVRAGGYLGPPTNELGYYPNPVKALNTSYYDARCVPVGCWSAGDFSYIPLAKAVPDQHEKATISDYMLVFYAEREHGGIDVTGDGKADGVILVTASGSLAGSDEEWQGALRAAWEHLPMSSE